MMGGELKRIGDVESTSLITSFWRKMVGELESVGRKFKIRDDWKGVVVRRADGWAGKQMQVECRRINLK